MAQNQELIAWLRDAYSMEQQAIEILENQERRLDHYPELQAKVREHLAQTRRQRDLVRDCLLRHGTDTSAIKTTMGWLAGNAATLMSTAASDEVVKNAMADYAFEHFEISSYRCLIAAADFAGDMETKRICEEILREEEAMASWLEDMLPVITQKYLQRTADMQFRRAQG